MEKLYFHPPDGSTADSDQRMLSDDQLIEAIEAGKHA